MSSGLKLTITANTVSPSSFKEESFSSMALHLSETNTGMEESKRNNSEDEPVSRTQNNQTSVDMPQVEADEELTSPVGVVDGASSDPSGQPTIAKDALVTPTNVVSPTAATNPPSMTAKETEKPSSSMVKTLDRAQEVNVSDLDEAKTPDSHGASVAHEDDGDSSNDDSSYFADPSNLPSPKSGGRKYSFSSHHSAPQPNSSSHHASSSGNPRESDASLSLSDSDDDHNNDDDDGDDDDDHDDREENHHSDSGLYPQPRGTPDVYPQRIMRVHSVGSLISTSSHNSSEDQIIHDELNNLAAARSLINATPGDIPSGRLSPVHVGHLTFASPTSQLPQASPPTIMPYQYNYHHNYIHPRAQTATIVAGDWMAGMHNHKQFGTVPNNNSAWSEGTLNYSDDGEMHAFQQNVSQSAKGAQGTNVSSTDRSAARNHPLNRSNGGSSRSAESNLMASSSRKGSGGNGQESGEEDGIYQVYWRRWIMLLYMSVLNLLSDWTCYSVAPIALLTQQAFGNINPEELVVVFLAANAVATACEPIILSRLGLRRTVLFGALLLMIGSIVKSGGMPPIIQSDLKKGSGEWRVYLGFFLVGLSQPLYQCTPALLSASWFPEKERTMATGVALNANQLGIGFAFIFGTLLVAKSDDIPGYFGLLSLISTITFFGALFQFEDAPPTPPSQTARIARGDLVLRLPSVRQVLESIGISGRSDVQRDINTAMADSRNGSSRSASSGSKARRNRGSSGSGKTGKKYHSTAPAPSAAPWDNIIASAPSPMMSGSLTNPPSAGDSEENEGGEQGQQAAPPPTSNPFSYGQVPYYGAVPPPPPPQIGYPMYPGMAYNTNGMAAGGASFGEVQQGRAQYGSTRQASTPFGAQSYGSVQSSAPYGLDGTAPPTYGFPPLGYPPYPMPYFDPRSGQYVYPPPPLPPYYAMPTGQGDLYGHGLPRGSYPFTTPYGAQLSTSTLDEGAEPVVTVMPNHLDIDIRDDQVLLSIRACLARSGFLHALVSFTVSGIVINTLSTFMDYLVRLNGAGREMTGIVGGTFQFVIMISSLVIGGMTDRSRAYYSVTVGMLVLGAFGLAECGVSLNSDRGGDLRWALIIVAVLVGPLQPVSTELGVEVVYPLSENTVLVIQQLFSNLLSAIFIPCFKKMKDIGINQIDTSVQQPEYTFSFYLLIVLHAAATVFFATFNGRYLRYEHELQRKEKQEQKEDEKSSHLPYSDPGMKQPLLQNSFV